MPGSAGVMKHRRRQPRKLRSHPLVLNPGFFTFTDSLEVFFDYHDERPGREVHLSGAPVDVLPVQRDRVVV